MWKHWNELVEKNSSKESIIAWAYPVSNGLYLPSPLTSIDMAFAVETDSLLGSIFPGEEWSLFPPDPFTYFVNGEDDFVVGWLQYMCYRFPNAMGWTSYKEKLTKIPHIDLTRIIRLVDDSSITQIKQSNPLGVNVVIQSSIQHPNKLSIPALRINGDFVFITTLPMEDETILNELFMNFKHVYMVRPYWTTPPNSPLIVIVGVQYLGEETKITKDKLDEYEESKKSVLKAMLEQQKYIDSLNSSDIKGTSSPTFIDFLQKGYSTWDI